MLLTKHIVEIEDELTKPNGYAVIISPHRYVLDAIRSVDFRRIALPARVCKSDRIGLVLDNGSRVKFYTSNREQLRALRCGLLMAVAFTPEEVNKYNEEFGMLSFARVNVVHADY